MPSSKCHYMAVLDHSSVSSSTYVIQEICFTESLENDAMSSAKIAEQWSNRNKKIQCWNNRTMGLKFQILLLLVFLFALIPLIYARLSKNLLCKSPLILLVVGSNLIFL